MLTEYVFYNHQTKFIIPSRLFNNDENEYIFHEVSSDKSIKCSLMTNY